MTPIVVWEYVIFGGGGGGGAFRYQEERIPVGMAVFIVLNLRSTSASPRQTTTLRPKP